jgi:RNA polymerase sigma-70 factor (ECF subfamily)
MTNETKAAADPFKRDLLAVVPNLRAFAVSLCGNPDRADDLVQDAILKAWGAQANFHRWHLT